MCFAPQWRTLFEFSTSKSAPTQVILTFLLPNVLRTKTTCAFSTSTLPKLFQTWCAFNALTSKCASRTTFGCWSGIFGGARHGFSTFTQIELNNGRRGTFEKDLQTCISHGRRSTRDISIRHVRRSGRWFPQRGCILSSESSGLLRRFCVTGAALRMTWPDFSWPV